VRQFGWKKDERDERDYLFLPRIPKLPEEVELNSLPFVRDQGQVGSCVGFGIGGVLTGLLQQSECEWFSPTWIYNGARKLEGTLSQDAGAYPRDALKFLKSWGSLPEHFRPYQMYELDTTDPLTWGVTEEAAKYPLVSYTRVTDGVEFICSALAEGHLVALGGAWYASWMDPPSTGVLPEKYDRVVGGHEVFLYGYSLTTSRFYGQNSWGVDWGNKGRFEMPFSALEAMKADTGYDAHYIEVDWKVEPKPKRRFPWWWIVLGAAGLGGLVLGLKQCGG
jgi:hypothetical protein